MGDITTAAIQSADAIMFLKPLTGVGIGARDFKDFLERNSADRNKKALFLILTHSAAASQMMIIDVRNDHIKMYGKSENGAGYGLEKEQILAVDSKAECYYNSLKKCSREEIISRMQTLSVEGKAEPFLKEAWFDAVGDKEIFLRKLKEYSGFDAIDQALSLFGRKAQFLAMSEFLKKMQKVYTKLTASLSETIEWYELKAESPEQLAARIQEIMDTLDGIEKKISGTVGEIASKYKGENGIIDKKATEVMEEYKREVGKISGTDDASLDKLEKLTLQQVDKFVEFETKLQQDIVTECRKAIGELSDSSEIAFVTLEPDLSEEVINEIKAAMRNEATEESFAKKTGGCSKKAKQKAREVIRKFNPEKFFAHVKEKILEEVEKTKKDAVKELGVFVDKTLKTYKSELEHNAENKKSELNRVREEKKSADEIAAMLEMLNGLLKEAEPQKSRVECLQGSIIPMC